MFPHPDPHSDSGIEAYRRLPGPIRVEPDTVGTIGESCAENPFEGSAGDVPPPLGGIDIQARDGDQVGTVIHRADGDRADALGAGEQPERAGVLTVRARQRAIVGADTALVDQAIFLGQPGDIELNVEVTLDQGTPVPAASRFSYPPRLSIAAR